jgi:N-methylhydantoinase A/oxoprolinase/acetone carboxylase beta subunit
MALDRIAADAAVQRDVADPLGLALSLAAFGVSEIVDENMANAARVHAIESGKDARGRTLIAFGGAAPLHAARMADKLGLDRVVVPSNAGVGSAVGFLRAPIAYEIVRSQLQRLDAFDADAANALLAVMRTEAEAIVRRGEPAAPLTESRSAFMRYRGQGHEIAVPVPARPYRAEDAGDAPGQYVRAARVAAEDRDREPQRLVDAHDARVIVFSRDQRRGDPHGRSHGEEGDDRVALGESPGNGAGGWSVVKLRVRQHGRQALSRRAPSGGNGDQADHRAPRSPEITKTGLTAASRSDPPGRAVSRDACSCTPDA